MDSLSNHYGSGSDNYDDNNQNGFAAMLPPSSATNPNTLTTSESPSSVLFTSPASYSPLVWCLLAIGPVVTIATIVLVQYYPSTEPADKDVATWVLLAATLFQIGLFLLVLPKFYRVHTDKTVDVVTFACTFRARHVLTARKDERGLLASAGFSAGGTTSSSLLALKFATDLSSRVVVRRGRNCMDLVVSPADADGFVRAVNEGKSPGGPV